MFDLNAKYKADGWGEGIAWYCTGYEISHDEDYEWTGIETYNYDRITMVMVGDDREFTFDIEDLTVIDEEDYCPECGQIGCKAYG